MHDRSFRLHNLGFAVGLLILLLLGWQNKRTQDGLLHANASVTRSLEVITAVQATRSALQDVETGMRGYVITGQAEFLQPFHDGQAQVRRQLAELERLVGARAGREAWLRTTIEAVDQRVALARENVAVARSEGLAPAAARVRTAGGREAMDRVRGLLDELETEERRLLANEHLQVRQQLGRAVRMDVAGGLGAVLLLLAALMAVNRHLRARAVLAAQAQGATARQTALLQAVPDALWHFAPDGRARLLSAGRADALPPTIDARLRSLLPTVHGDGPHAFEATDSGRDFEVRVVGAGDGHLAIVRDITEAQRTRRALDDQRGFLRTIVDTDENLIFVRDADGRFALCNVAFCDLVQLDPSQMEGRLPEQLARHALVAPLLQGDATLAGGDDEWRAERVQITDAQGATRWLQVLKRPFVRAGETRQVLTVAVDISARLRAEQLKNEFVSTVSHELRTPLTSIRGALSMLESGMAGEMPPSAGPLLGIAHKNTERLVRLINDILDIEKLESGRLQLNTRVLPARALVAQSIEQIAPYAAEFEVALDLHGSDDALVDVDPDRFAQVMANLLSNAIKHSPRGGRVDVDVVRRDEGLEVVVRDHGAGIPEDFQPRVFERFAQADASDARLRGGTGLGLAITRSLVEQMGGGIGFTTSAGDGTRFRIWLPEVVPAAGPGVSYAHAQKPRLVLLEDEPSTARELANMVERHGYAVDVAVTVGHARELLDTPRVCGLAIDLALAGGTGPAFLRELRSQPRFRHLPVLLIGVERREQPREAVRGGAVGVVDWLAKPLDPARVAEAVRLCLRGGGLDGPAVLHVEDDADMREVLAGLLAPQPLRLDPAGSLAEARARLGAHRYDLVILDLMLPDGDGAALLPELGAMRPPVPVIIFSAHDTTLDESGVVLRRLVKSRQDANELATLINENLRCWPETAAQVEEPR